MKNPSLRRGLATPCIHAVWVTAAMLMTVSCGPGDGPITNTTASPLSLVDGIDIEPDSVEMAVGDTVELRVVVLSRVNLPAEVSFNFSVRWLVGDTNVATLGSRDGSLTGFSFVIAPWVLVQAMGVGGTTVVASLEQSADTAIVIVR